MEAIGATRTMDELLILGDACEQTEVEEFDGHKIFRPMSIPGIAEMFNLRKLIYTTTGEAPFAELDMTTPNVASLFPFNVFDKYAGFSCELVFETTVTATMETAGLLVMSVSPYQPVADGGIDYTNVSRVFGIPHVDLNVSYRKTAELVVPFPMLLPFAYIQGLAGGKLPDLNHFIFRLTTAVNIVASSAAPTFSTAVFVSIRNLKVFAQKPVTTVQRIVLQSGEKTAVGYAAGHLAKFSKPSWWLEAAAETARAFGYSTPQTTAAPERIVNTNTANEVYYDVPRLLDVVHPNSKATTVTCADAMATTEDQMSLQWLCSRYSLLGSANGNNLTNNVCMYVPISLPHLWYRGQSTTLDCTTSSYPNVFPAEPDTHAMFQPTGILYWASMFQRWRGSLKFKLQLVRPRFSQGKIAINFAPAYLTRIPPYMGNTEVSVSAGDDTNARLIEIELGDEETVEFVIPYMGNTHSACFEDMLGMISVSWVSGYQGPVGVPCTLLLYVAGGDDFMLMDPVAPRLVPTLRRDYEQMQSGDDIVLESGDQPGSIHAISNVDQLAALNDNGMIKSVKQLLCLPYWSRQSIPVGSLYCYFAPWMWRQVFKNGNDNNVPSYADSYQNVVSACFLYGKGGTEVHIYTPNDDAVVTFASVPTTSIFSNEYKSKSSVDTPISGPVYVKGPHHAKHFVVPCIMRHSLMPLWPYMSYSGSYSRDLLPYAFNAFGYGLSENNLPENSIFPLRIPAAVITTVSIATITWGIAAADDASLTFYMGPPPCFVRPNDGISAFHPTAIF